MNLAMAGQSYRIGEAAAMLGVRVETLRRWERQGRLKLKRSKGGQRLVSAAEVAKLLAAKRRSPDRPIAKQSARNRFAGKVTAVKVDGLVATVEILAGPHRVLALTTREAVEELELKPGMDAIAAVKATNVIVEVPT
jgi:molybdopterin-binding protein